MVCIKTFSQLHASQMTDVISTNSLHLFQELKAFAITLQYYSTRAYEYVRQTFLKVLPHVSTIRKWFGNIESGPGFSSLALTLLEERVKEESEKEKIVYVALMLDDMSLKKQIDFDIRSQEFKGFVDIGDGPCQNNPIPAKEVLVLMAVGINNHFKLPLGYFFISGLNGKDRAELVKTALRKIHDTGKYFRTNDEFDTLTLVRKN